MNPITRSHKSTRLGADCLTIAGLAVLNHEYRVIVAFFTGLCDAISAVGHIGGEGVDRANAGDVGIKTDVGVIEVFTISRSGGGILLDAATPAFRNYLNTGHHEWGLAVYASNTASVKDIPSTKDVIVGPGSSFHAAWVAACLERFDAIFIADHIARGCDMYGSAPDALTGALNAAHLELEAIQAEEGPLIWDEMAQCYMVDGDV